MSDMSKTGWWGGGFTIFLMVIALFPRSIKYEDAKNMKNLYPYLQDISMRAVIGCWSGDMGRLYAERCHLRTEVDQNLILSRLLNDGWIKTSRPDFGGELSFSWCKDKARINSGKYGEEWLLEYIEAGNQKC